MAFNRADADNTCSGDLTVALALQQKIEHARFGRRQLEVGHRIRSVLIKGFPSIAAASLL